MSSVPFRFAFALLILVPFAAATAQDILPRWLGTWDFLVQSVCIDDQDRVLPGVTPLDEATACPRQRKPRMGERLPYHKRDWTNAAGGLQADGLTVGYQQSDSFPVQTSAGPAVVQTFDFSDAVRRFGVFDQGDGGQVVFFSDTTASVGITEDGGAGLQFFLGPGCTPVDSWILVDSSFPDRPSGEALARITRRPDRCLGRLGYAYTRWRLQPVGFRAMVHGHPAAATLSTLVTDHFAGKAVDTAESLERMYFTRELGFTRWERWENLSVHDLARSRNMAATIAASDRCQPGLGSPSAVTRWVMTDCREWTQIVPPADPAGDLPSFWLDRLRRAPETSGIFPP